VARVRLVELEKVYPNGHVAARGLDLDIADGEFMVLVGPSGCGKSTALRMIAGLETPTGGQVFIGERDVTAVPPQDRDIAMVFQSYALYPHMTVRQNLAFGLRALAQLQRERKVVAHGHVRVEGVALEHHRDVAVARGNVVHHAVADGEPPLADRLQPRDHPQRGALAAARRPDQHHELLVRNLQVDAVDHFRLLEYFHHLLQDYSGHDALLG